MNSRLIAFAGLLFVVLVTLLLMPINQSSREVAAAMDACHAPAFAALAGAVYRAAASRWLRRPVSSGLVVWVLVAGLGLLTEWGQNMVGRLGTWHDAIANGVGALAGILAARSWDLTRRGRWSLRGLSGLLLLAAAIPACRVLLDGWRQRQSFPQLASFEHELELSRWMPLACHLHRAREHATSGDWAARIDLLPEPYSGIATWWPCPDWSAHRELAFDVWIDAGAPLDLLVKVEDRQHNGEHFDRFNRVLRLEPGPHAITIPLSEIRSAPHGRELDLSDIRFLQWVVIRPSSTRSVYLDNVRLQ